MAVENKAGHKEDEEDLEALRVAALNSLKKKNEASESGLKKEFNVLPYNNYRGSYRGGKRRFFPGQSSRGNRNGQFNSVRNTNLISIPTSTQEPETNESRTLKFATKNDDPPKLVLPQDRYANAAVQEAESDGPSSKFDRYDNSNSESEDEDEVSDSKLERCDSLEALMDELDAEILGEPVKERKSKVKKEAVAEEKVVDEVKTEEVSADSVKEIEKSEEIVVSGDKNLENIQPTEEKPETVVKDDVKVENPNPNVKPQTQRSPVQRKMHHRINNGRVFKPHPPVNIPIMHPNPPFMNHGPQFTTVYNTVPSYSIPEAFPMNVPPPYIPPPGMQHHALPPPGYNAPPLHPLIIEPPSSVPMGPLSPRSAAFVMQNRAIVEKRKRSPRRSFSRSPSPPHHRPRYSNSPVSGRPLSPLRRSLSPVRRPFSPLQRSLSPRRSPVRRSLSPYRRNTDKSLRRESPRRGRVSPRRSPKRGRDSPKRNKESRRTPVKDRLGNRNKNEEKEPVSTSTSKKSDTKSVDPVLEARKRKFESKEINVKEKVIRLRPKEEPVPKDKDVRSRQKENSPKPKSEKPDKLATKPILEKIKEKTPPKSPKTEESTRIVLLPKNETKSPAQAKIPGEPQEDQLEDAINELEMLLKDDEALELSAKVDDLFTDEEIEDVESKKAPNVKPNGVSKPTSDKRREAKTKWKFEEPRKESKKVKKEPLTNPIENRKIEIKIRNPSKYEKEGAQGAVQSSRERTIEMAKRESFSEDESEPEIVMEEEEFEEVATSREGDLRAQLSRKRAERQSKLPSVEGVQSRLLQNALEGAVFKKKKSKKDKESKECRMVKRLIRKHRCVASHCDLAVHSKRKVRLYRRFEICRRFLTDVKLPIHLRLGVTHESDVFAESIVSEKTSRKKSKKRKHGDMEQV